MKNMAFDKSNRKIDVDGRLHVKKSHISKATINPYHGREIPDFEALGLQADKVYNLLRDPRELEKAAPTFARLPILSEHVPVTVDAPRPDLVVGAIGSEVTFNAPYLDADICIWDAAAIAGIETNSVRELSCAYRYVPVMQPGEFEGQVYDGIMTQIQGNHLALVELGRAGSDVVVSDQNPFIFNKESAMKMTKLGKALFASLSAASPTLAADSAMPALVGTANKKTFDKSSVKSKLIALDANLNAQQLDNIIDALLDVEQEPKAVEMPMAAADESPVEKLRKMLEGKVDDDLLNAACKLFEGMADDGSNYSEKGEAYPRKAQAQDDEVMKKDEVKAAMDGLRKQLREAEEARRDVRGIVGDLIGMDSAAEVYSFALDHMKVDRKDVDSVAALRALFKVAATKSSSAPVHIAQDSGGLEKMFPNASRFLNA